MFKEGGDGPPSVLHLLLEFYANSRIHSPSYRLQAASDVSSYLIYFWLQALASNTLRMIIIVWPTQLSNPLSQQSSHMSSRVSGLALITFGKKRRRLSSWSGGRRQSIAKGPILTGDLGSVRLMQRQSGRILMSAQMQQLGSQDFAAVPAMSFSFTQTYADMETQLPVATCGAVVLLQQCIAVAYSSRSSTWYQRYDEKCKTFLTGANMAQKA